MLLPVLQAVALAAAVVFLARMTRSYWGTVTSVPITLAWGPLALASLVWYVSFVQLVQSWSSSLTWWGWHVQWYEGLRMFFFSNLARYIPGGIWQFAGLAALAANVGASPVAASAAVLLLQLVLLITGFLLTLGATPDALGPWASALGTHARAIVGGVAAIVLVFGFPRALPWVRTRAERLLKRAVPLPIPPLGPWIVYCARCAVAWAGYGISFWMFCHSILGPSVPGVWFTSSAYVASYLIGLLAVFAPGGIIVREAALVIALRGELGPERALLVAVGSRLWLIALEVLGALVLMGIDRVAASRRRTLSPRT